MKKKKLAFQNPFVPPGIAIELPQYSTGEAAEILGMPIWRLQKFLDSPRYQLSPAGHLGEGKGSRRMFSKENLYRIAVAAFLIRDGFSPKFVAGALQFVEDQDFFDLDELSNQTSMGISFSRGKKGPQMGFFPSGRAPEVKGGQPYYVLDFAEVISDVDRRIRQKRDRREREK